MEAYMRNEISKATYFRKYNPLQTNPEQNIPYVRLKGKKITHDYEFPILMYLLRFVSKLLYNNEWSSNHAHDNQF